MRGFVCRATQKHKIKVLSLALNIVACFIVARKKWVSKIFFLKNDEKIF